jgi:HlyD family secretion protein
MDVQLAKKKLRGGVRWVVASGVLTLVCGAGWWLYANNFGARSQAIAVRAIDVELGTIEKKIDESGIVEFGNQQTLKSPTDATVDTLWVEVGDRVDLGSELLRLRDSQQQLGLNEHQLKIRQQELTLAYHRDRLQNARLAVEAAETDLAAKIAQTTRSEQIQLEAKALEIEKQQLTVANTQAKIETAQGELDAAREELEEVAALVEKGYIPSNELRAAQDEIRNGQDQLREAELDFAIAQLELKNLQLDRQRLQQERQDKLAQQEAEIRQARSALREAQATLANVDNEVRTAEIELENLELERQRLAKELQANIITAPISGAVLDLFVKPGDGVERGKDLLVLGDPRREVVKLQLSTLNAKQVEVNQAARVSLIGPNPKTFEGRVRSLSPLASTSATDSSGRQSGQATIAAIVELDRPSNFLIPGSQVSVEIILQRREEVVVLQMEAIQRDEKDPYVWVRADDGTAQKQAIALGLEGIVEVEVTEGLEPGDRVILPPVDVPLQPGIPVIEEDEQGQESAIERPKIKSKRQKPKGKRQKIDEVLIS